jgi:hypothetical protein
MSPQTHRQVLLDTAKEYGWEINHPMRVLRWHDLCLQKGNTKLLFRFDKRDRIWAASHHEFRGANWSYTSKYPSTKKLDYAIEVLRGPLRPPVELGLLKKGN